MRSLQGVQGGYKTPKRGMRRVQDTYNGYNANMRSYKGYEVGTRYIQEE